MRPSVEKFWKVAFYFRCKVRSAKLHFACVGLYIYRSALLHQFLLTLPVTISVRNW